MDSYNATGTAISGLNTMASWTPALGIITALVFLIIIIGVYLAFKNFRRFCLGIIIIAPTAFVGWISWLIAKQTTQGNNTPISVLIGIVTGIALSIIVGLILEKTTKWGKKFTEEDFSETKGQTKKENKK